MVGPSRWITDAAIWTAAGSDAASTDQMSTRSTDGSKNEAMVAGGSARPSVTIPASSSRTAGWFTMFWQTSPLPSRSVERSMDTVRVPLSPASPTPAGSAASITATPFVAWSDVATAMRSPLTVAANVIGRLLIGNATRAVRRVAVMPRGTVTDWVDVSASGARRISAGSARDGRAGGAVGAAVATGAGWAVGGVAVVVLASADSPSPELAASATITTPNAAKRRHAA